MFRVSKTSHDALKKRKFNESPSPPHYHDIYEIGRKTVYESEHCKVVVEHGTSLVVGYGGDFLTDNMPMAPCCYQGIPMASADTITTICRNLYYERDPLLESADSPDCTFWGYLAQIVHVTAQRWKFTHRLVFEEMKEIESIARRARVGPESVYFCQSLDIDVLLCVDRIVHENELASTFRYHVWGTKYDEYVEWFEELPLLFDLQVE